MSLTSKIGWISGLLAMLVILVVISQANVINCQKVQQSIHELYEDRLVVKGFIIELLSAVHQKELAAASGDLEIDQGANSALNEEINAIMERFRATKLTPEELSTLTRLQSKFDELAKTETRQALSDVGPDRISKQIREIKSHLGILSRIQRDEGERVLRISVQASQYVTVTARVGKYLAGVIVLVMIFVVLVQPRDKASDGSSPA